MTSEAAPPGPPRSWSARQTVAAVAVAVVVGGIGGAAVYAATQEPPHMGGGFHGSAGPMHGPPAPGAPPQAGPPAAPALAGGALHSEFVVSDGKGGFVTKIAQIGTVDEVTLSDMVVRSDDGYTQIYAFPSQAAASSHPVVANDKVTVDATRTGATVTLNSISDAPAPAN